MGIRLRFDDLEQFLEELSRIGSNTIEGPCVRMASLMRKEGRKDVFYFAASCVVGDRVVTFEGYGPDVEYRDRVKEWAAENGLKVLGGVYEVC